MWGLHFLFAVLCHFSSAFVILSGVYGVEESIRRNILIIVLWIELRLRSDELLRTSSEK